MTADEARKTAMLNLLDTEELKQEYDRIINLINKEAHKGGTHLFVDLKIKIDEYKIEERLEFAGFDTFLNKKNRLSISW